MNIGIVQYSPVWENPIDNILTIKKMLADSLTDEDMIIFPEMSLTGFTMEASKFAEELDGDGTRFFISMSRQYKKHIFAGIIEKDEENIFNSLVHFDEQGLIKSRYRKIHPFSFAKEEKFYTAGEEPVSTKIEQTKIGLSVCYDLRFPELFRLYAKERAEILINIANWPVPRIEHWKQLLKARAIENQCFMIGVNRVGSDPFNKYIGCSAVIDPMGNELISIENEEGLFSVEIDLSKVKELRSKLPFLNDIKLV